MSDYIKGFMIGAASVFLGLVVDKHSAIETLRKGEWVCSKTTIYDGQAKCVEYQSE